MRNIGASSALQFAASAGAVVGVAWVIEITGGLPSQLAHLYYIPVVFGALVLPRRPAILIALLAGAAVSPLPDLVHAPLGLDLYYPDPQPWNLTTDGWIARPVAFLAISLLTGALVRRSVATATAEAAAEARAALLAGKVAHERTMRMTTEAASAHRGKELALLSQIDKTIVSGCTERELVQEVCRLVASFTGARMAGIALPDEDRKLMNAFYGHDSDGGQVEISEEGLPLGEGVSGWALRHRQTTTSSNVFKDSRYGKMAEFARRRGYVSAAAAPIVLDDAVLGALAVCYDRERDFSPDELCTLERLADQAAVAITYSRQRESLRRMASETPSAVG